MDHLAFSLDEACALEKEGWKVLRTVLHPSPCWLLENPDAASAVITDPTGALAFLSRALAPPLWVPTSRNVLAHTVINQGRVAVICSQERALLSECLHDPRGETFQIDVGVASLNTPRDLLGVFKDALKGSQASMVRVVVTDKDGEGLFLDFPLKTAALVVGHMAKGRHEVPQVLPQEDPSPADDTKH